MSHILIKQETVDLITNSSVKEVVLYFNKAQVTRTRQEQLQAGENRVVFMNLGHGIDESSVKARIQAKEAVITSTSLVRNQLYFFRQAEDEARYNTILESLKKLAALLDQKTVLALENHIIRDLRNYIRLALNEIMLEQEIPLARLKNALSLLETKIDQTSRQLLDLDEEVRLLSEQITLLKEELDKIRQLDRKEQNNIEIIVQAEKTITMEFEISYILPGAWWRTSYDAKLDTKTDQVRFFYYGEVRQLTGEHWENARILLSTAETTRSMEIPAIYPVYLSGYEEKRDKTLIIQRADAKKELSAEREEMGDTGAEEEEEPAESPVAAVRKGTTYTFEVSKPYTVPADGLWHKVLILETEMEAESGYETIPEAMEYVYLKANLKNISALPLLAGKVAVYRNESYTGKSNLSYAAPQESFSLSFGIDEDLKVKRVRIYKGVENKKLLTKNERYWSYKFVLYNYKSSRSKVILKEAVYHSMIKEVEVEILGTTTGEYKKSEDGVLSWELTLPSDPFNYTTVELDYKVVAPKSFNLAAL